MPKLKNFKLWYSLGIFIILLYLFLEIAFLNYGQGLLSDTFTRVYFYLSLASVVLFGFFMITDFTKFVPRNSPISFGFIFEDNPISPLAKPRIKFIYRILPHLILTIIFTITVVSLKSAILPVPEAFNQDVLSSVSDFDNIKYRSIYPGFTEEAVIFGINRIFMLIFMTLFAFYMKINKALSFLISSLLSAGIGAFVFVQGHIIAYGYNQAAMFSAFIFEFMVQLANSVTGIFMSWLPHLAHNYVVLAFAYTIVFAIGGYFNIILPIWRKKNEI